MTLLLGACAGPPDASVAAAPGPPPAEAPLAVDAPRTLRLIAARPPEGSLVQPLVSLQLEFDRALDPASIARAVTLEHPDPGVTLLADPLRHVTMRLVEDGRTLVIEPPEMLVGREVRVRISEALRGADGSRPAAEMPATLMYRVMELPP